MTDAVAALEAFLQRPAPPDSPRGVVHVHSRQLLVMSSESATSVGVKLASVVPDNPGRGLQRMQALYVLLDADTLRPVALLDGVAITSLRTPAVSALSATRRAVPDAAELVVFGAGPQAWKHVLPMLAVRLVCGLRVVGRDLHRVGRLVKTASAPGIPAEAAGAEAVHDADVLCTCTTAREPLFDGAELPAAAHVVAVGSHELQAREVDSRTVPRAFVVVEDRTVALREAGDIVQAIAEWVIGPRRLKDDFRELVAARGVDPSRLRLFKSVGMAWEDLAIAEFAHTRASAVFAAGLAEAPVPPVERTAQC